MKATLAIAVLLIASKTVANDFDGAWVLSGEWTGYMGPALKIRGDQYKYWFSSDVMLMESTLEVTMPDGHVERYTYKEKPLKYPLTGRVVVRGDMIELRGPGEYYDRKWRRIVVRSVLCLLAERHYVEWKKTGELPEDRLLFSAPTFDEKHPRLNYGGVEQPDGSVTRTSPLPPK